jgi:alanine racemase
VPRRLSNRIHGLLGGRRVPQVGTITMDQMMFDITGVPEAAIGDTVTLLGREETHGAGEAVWLDDWARKASTIEYELMCALRVRLPKTYIR